MTPEELNRKLDEHIVASLEQRPLDFLPFASRLLSAGIALLITKQKAKGMNEAETIIWLKLALDQIVDELWMQAGGTMSAEVRDPSAN